MISFEIAASDLKSTAIFCHVLFALSYMVANNARS